MWQLLGILINISSYWSAENERSQSGVQYLASCLVRASAVALPCTDRFSALLRGTALISSLTFFDCFSLTSAPLPWFSEFVTFGLTSTLHSVSLSLSLFSTSLLLLLLLYPSLRVKTSLWSSHCTHSVAWGEPRCLHPDRPQTSMQLEWSGKGSLHLTQFTSPHLTSPRLALTSPHIFTVNTEQHLHNKTCHMIIASNASLSSDHSTMNTNSSQALIPHSHHLAHLL